MNTNPTEQQPDRLTFLLLTQAYNRGDISYEEWLARTREWAEAMIARSAPRSPKSPVKREASD